MNTIRALVAAAVASAWSHECPSVRSDRFLLATTHNGFGNQYLALEKAAWLAYALNRTLVAPPVLSHSSNGFAIWPGCKESGIRNHTRNARDAYLRLDNNNALRWTRLLNFSALAAAGVRVVDFATVGVGVATAGDAVRAVDLWEAGLGEIYDATSWACSGRGWGLDKWRSYVGRKRFDVRVIAAPSTLRMELEALRIDMMREPCGRAVIAEAVAAPFVAPVRHIAARAAAAVGRFATVHLRTGDTFDVNAEARTAHFVKAVAPALKAHGLPVFIAADLPQSASAFATFLRAVCPTCGQSFGSRRVDPSATLAALLGDRETAGVALDIAFGARARHLHLSDRNTASFRQTSTFGRLLKRHHLRSRIA